MENQEGHIILQKALDKVLELSDLNQQLEQENRRLRAQLKSKTVWVCTVNTTYFDDKINYVSEVYDAAHKADFFKQNYTAETHLKAQESLPASVPETDEGVDAMSETLKAKKFVSVEIEKFTVK